MKRYTLLLLLFLIPTTTGATNAGIVQGLWFDREAFFAGDTVRVYVAIRNNTGGDLSGTVEFYVDDERIERNNVDSLDGRIIESWADWSPQYGSSTIRATLSRTEISSSASGTEAIAVTSPLAETTIFVDADTDGDLLGNEDDPDDDNDGIIDAEDENPLDFDQPEVTETEVEINETETAPAVESESTEAANPNEPAGLEQYLTESRADTAFSTLTGTINETKKRLDDYRVSRTSGGETPVEPEESLSDSSGSTTATSSDITTDADGFGEVSRSSDTPATEKTGWLTLIWNVLSVAFSAVYSVILAALSFILGYPSLLQVFLLILIIYIVMRTAARFARRPS